MGTLCSCVLLLTVLWYTVYKTNIMFAKKDVDIVQAVLENHFDPDYSFSADNGLNFAVTVVNPFDPSSIERLDPSYGRIRFRNFNWGFKEGNFWIDMPEIKSHACSVEELGLSGNDPKFWPAGENYVNLLNLLSPVLDCIDQKDMQVQGQLTTETSITIQADIVMCTGKDYCKSEEEIKAFFAQRYIWLLSNQIRFDPQKYGQSSIIKESKIFVLPVGNWQSRRQYQVDVTELVLQDLVIKLDEMTSLHDNSIFALNLKQNIPFYNERDLIEGIMITMGSDLIVIQREGYTILDILSDVGGLQGILISGMGLVLGIWNHNYFDNYLISKLYKTSQDVSRSGRTTDASSKVDPLQDSKTNGVKEFCIDKILPKKLVKACCRSAKDYRQQILRERARIALTQEVNIVHWIRLRRFVHLALKCLLDAQVLKQLRDECLFDEVNDDEQSLNNQTRVAPSSQFSVNQGVISSGVQVEGLSNPNTVALVRRELDELPDAATEIQWTAGNRSMDHQQPLHDETSVNPKGSITFIHFTKHLQMILLTCRNSSPLKYLEIKHSFGEQVRTRKILD